MNNNKLIYGIDDKTYHQLLGLELAKTRLELDAKLITKNLKNIHSDSIKSYAKQKIEKKEDRIYNLNLSISNIFRQINKGI